MGRLRCVAVLATILIGGCASTVQTTSGGDYLKRYAEVPYTSSEEFGATAFDIDAAVRSAAAIEPVLEFPARIGLVRIGRRGQISSIPYGEAQPWVELAQRLGDRFGEFVPINPLIAELATPAKGHLPKEQLSFVSQVRLAAARQHLDAVLLYEVMTSSQISKNGLAATELAVIPLFILPGRQLKSEAVGSALLIDVVQGYPYGTVEARVDERALATSWHSSSKLGDMEARLRETVTVDLAAEAEAMFSELRTQLAEQRLEAYRRREQ